MVYFLLTVLSLSICANDQVFTSAFIQKHYPPIQLEQIIKEEQHNIFPLSMVKDCGICYLKPGNEWDRLLGNAALDEAIKGKAEEHFEVVEKFFFPSFDRHGYLLPHKSVLIAMKIDGKPVRELCYAEAKHLMNIVKMTGLGRLHQRDLIRSSIDDAKIYLVNTKFEYFMHENPTQSISSMLMGSPIKMQTLTKTYLEFYCNSK